MNLIEGIAAICTIVVSTLPILKKILPFGSSNSEEKKLLEELHLYAKIKELLKESNPSTGLHLAQRGTQAQYRGDPIFRAIQDRIRERTVIHLALKEYPRAKMFLSTSAAILSSILLICFSILTSPLLLYPDSTSLRPLWYSIIICSSFLGFICFCLGFLGERQRCFEDYTEQLRNNSSPLIPRQPDDDIQFNGKGSLYRYTISWVAYSFFYVFLFLCTFLPLAISSSDTSSSSIAFETINWRVISKFLAICFLGSGLVTGFLRWVREKSSRKKARGLVTRFSGWVRERHSQKKTSNQTTGSKEGNHTQ
ncbi:hypothetical protein GWO69_04965 [Corynebacterium macginleyi]|uniref:hypothetical protein n=1 Tax=Corynebacterium macginleyi TaxID=38290 RepID=UPI0016053ABF|nr:hypothetical protein [Corynebacterium macginleyi]MBK4156802.1 hypothetical protein [Corynebacterium macginleyi]